MPVSFLNSKGAGDGNKPGKVKLSDATDSTSGVNDGVAATPAAVKAAIETIKPATQITAGTFAGQVVANGSGQTPGTSLLRNSKIVLTDEDPTVEGEIVWVCK